MDEPKRGVVKSYNPEGEEQELSFIERQASHWPQGRSAPANGWDPDYKGIWLVAELGLMRARSECLLVRAVTSDGVKHGLAGVEENTLRALAYEVVDIADDFPPAMLYHPEHNVHGLARGDHIVHLSASQDRLAPKDSGCPWFWVEAPDIAGSWRPAVLQEVLADSGKLTVDELIERARPMAEALRADAEERSYARVATFWATEVQSVR